MLAGSGVGRHLAVSIVRAIFSMARSLKLKVIAEGVEVEDEAAFLRAQNCDEAQGLLFGRPMSAENLGRD